MPNLKLPGYVCYGSILWLATLMVSNQRSWMFEKRCTAVLFGASAPTSLNRRILICGVIHEKRNKAMNLAFQSPFRTARTIWMKMRHSCWMLPKSYGKDDEQNRKNSMLPATSMRSWDYCVQTRTTSVSSVSCMVLYVGKGVKEITVVSRSLCGMELRRSSIARSLPRGLIVAGRKKWHSRTHNLGITLSGQRWKSDETYIYNDENMGLQGPVPHSSFDTRVWSFELLLCKEKKEEMDRMQANERRSKNWIPESCDVKGRRKARKKPGNNTQGYWGSCGQSGLQNKKIETKPWKKHRRMWEYVKRQLHGAQKWSKGEYPRTIKESQSRSPG